MIVDETVLKICYSGLGMSDEIDELYDYLNSIGYDCIIDYYNDGCGFGLDSVTSIYDVRFVYKLKSKIRKDKLVLLLK